MVRRIWALAVLTCREGVRDRAIYGIVLFALFVLGLNIVIADFFMRQLGKVTVDMNLSALSFAGLLLIFFVGINLMAKDIDKKTIHLVLSRPFSRGEYIWGKFIGLALLAVVTLAVLLVFSCITIAIVQADSVGYFNEFSWSVFFWAVLFLGMQLFLLCAVVVFFSTLTTSSFLTLILSLASYIIGISLEEVVFYIRSQAAAGEAVASEAVVRVIEVTSWLVPNFAAFDLKTEAAHGLLLDGWRLATTAGYGVTYIVILMWLATLVFRRREFN